MERAEALHELRSFIGQLSEGCREALETLIPELKESEDERIRKWLVGYFTRIGKSWIHREFTCNQIIAYLEKQKEASKAIEAVERIDKYIDEHLANAHDMKDSDPDKKYYRGWDDALGKMSGILQDVYSDEKQKDHFRDDTKMVEQKPAEWMAGQGWISVDEKLPEMDEEIIVLTDELGTAPIYKISFGHIVDVERCIDYNGWNIPGVKYWMPCPEIPNE